jgi:hypothetical protein
MKNKATVSVAKLVPQANAIPLLPSPNTKALLSGSKSFDWVAFLTECKDEVTCVPVSSFKNAPMSELWDDLVTISLKVEVRNTDHGSKLETEGYWIASVIQFAGYYVQLRFEGFGSDSSKDFWLNIFTSDIHPVGWCASQGKTLIPPASVESSCSDWKAFLLKRLTGSRTLPENFLEQLRESIQSKFTVGMRLEVIDKSRVSAVRVATVEAIIGGRLHLKYEAGDEEENDVGFWCHQFSPLIHPVGWAQLVGHELKATEQYATESLRKAMSNNFEINDATWTLFPPVKMAPTALVNSTSQHLNTQQNGMTIGFKEGMKLEAIDPLNLSTICVATVMKVLRSNYLMIGIDGMMSEDGSDWFCYHATSPCIFPVGFCKKNGIELTPPKDHEDFDWDRYLTETSSIAAPVSLFKKDIPSHSFKEGHYLEAVDLMEPRLVCVAQVRKVVGRLLRIHFTGWEDSFDQWCDCESSELFPVGWCHLVGYPLEPPKEQDKNDTSKKGKRSQKGKKGKRGRGASKSEASFPSQEDVDSEQESPPKVQRHVMHNRATDPVRESIAEAVKTPSASHSKKTSATPKTSKTSVSILSNSKVVVKPSPALPVIPCQRSNETDPSKWNIADVAHFLGRNDHDNYVATFVERVIGFQ